MSSGVRVIESEPVSDRLRRLFSKPAWVVAAVLVAAAIVAVVVTLFVLLSGGDAASGAVDYSKALIVADDYDLYAFDLESQQPRLLLKTSKGVRAFDLHGKKTIYWSEAQSRELSSLSPLYKNLTQQRHWQPVAVAVDSVTGNVYVLDARGRKLDVYHPESSTSFGIAVSDLREPVDLALDAQRGLVFIVQKSHSILKGNMDGSSVRVLVNSPSVSVVCLDRQSPRLYWAESDKIVSSDYTGRDVRVVLCTTGVSSIGVSGGRLFWAGQAKLWTCTASAGGACREEDVLQLPFRYPRALRVYSGELSGASNPCAEANGGCQHLCLLTVGGHSCACFLGFRLAGDARGGCELVKEFLLYARGDLVRGRALDALDAGEAFSDAIAPIPVRADAVLRDKPTVDFDYNYYTRRLAYSDDASIVTASLGGGEGAQGEQGAYRARECLKDVSFDWVTNDLYYVQDNCGALGGTSIAVLKPSGERRTLQSFARANGHPRSLVLDPDTGSYFFAVLLRGEARIYRAHGLRKTLFSRAEWSVNETGLALDAAERRLYWFSADLRRLHSASLEGAEDRPRWVDVSAVAGPRSVAVFRRNAYVSNLTGVWTLDKLTGHGLREIAPGFGGDEPVAGVKVHARAAQAVSPGNPCGVNNGDCQQFCLRAPVLVTSGPNSVNLTDRLQKVCLCADGSEIGSDGLTCA